MHYPLLDLSDCRFYSFMWRIMGYWSLISKLFPHINSPFLNLTVKTKPHMHLFQLPTLSHQTQRGDCHTLLPPTCHSHIHFEPAFQQLPRRQYCCNASAISIVFFCLERFHFLHQCMRHQPIFTLIQQNGHYTSIQYRPTREITFESTHAT